MPKKNSSRNSRRFQWLVPEAAACRTAPAKEEPTPTEIWNIFRENARRKI
jgi:hypothetical protein